MGAAVPTQVAAILTLGIGYAGCRENSAEPAESHRERQPQALAQALAGEPKLAIEALLTRSHGTLKGKEKMAVAFLNLGATANDDRPEQVILWTKNRMRVRRRNGQIDVRLSAGAWRATPDADCVEHTEAKVQQLDRLQGLLRAALLRPLYEAEQVRHQGGDVYQLILPGGETWRLEVSTWQPAKADSVLLPKSLSGPPGTVTWQEYLHTGVTHLPRVMKLDDFGKRYVSLERSNFPIDDSWFTDPLNPKAEKPGHEPPTMPVIQIDDQVVRVGRPKTGQPWLGTTRASRSLVSSDPDTWAERVELTTKKGQGELSLQGQEADDLDFIFRQDGGRWYAMPFRMDHRLGRGRPFVAKPSQRILRLPAQRVVFVRTKSSSIEAAEQAAEKALAQFLSRHELTAAGPLRIRPFVMMDQLAKTKEAPRKLEIQFEQPVRR